MEPNILKGLRIAVACWVLAPFGSGWISAGEAPIAALVTGSPQVASLNCSASEAELFWQGADGLEHRAAADFVSVCDPALDGPGRTLYFSGRRTNTEDIRVWSIDLRSNEISAVTPEGFAARRPFSLPDGSVVFISDGDLWRRGPESASLERLTFTQGGVVSAAVLPDGRILYLHRGRLGGRLFSMLPDGTWSTLWPGLDGLSVRDYVVVDQEQLLILDTNKNLWKASIQDPFALKRRIPIELSGSLQALFRADSGSAFVLAEIGGKSDGIATRVASLRLGLEPGISEIEAFSGKTVLALDSARPTLPVDVLPSIVKPEMETGFLFVIDVARTDDPELRELDRQDIAELRILRLEESGTKTVLFAVEPATDGSVYVEAPADTPLAVEMVDRQGDLIAETQTPIWIRPNERRGCIGCHVSPAYAPPNIRPAALVEEPRRIDADEEGRP